MPRVLLAAAAMLLGAAPPAVAQDEPIGLFVADLRGSFVRFGQQPGLARSHGFRPHATPSIGIGVDAGAHVYPLRWRFVTLGLGAAYHASFGDRGARPDDVDPDGPTLRKTFRAVSPQLSLNFGGRNGWSYLSGGIGMSRLALFPRDGEQPDQRLARTLNYGAGARWFVNRRVAFSLDLRFHTLSPREPTDSAPASPRLTLMVLSVGASFR